jgi:hypothetical protein
MSVGSVRLAWSRGCAGALVVLALAGCGSGPVDISSQLALTDVTSGWFDAGVVEGNKNKLVPTISFRLKNQGPGRISSVQINAVFRRVGETDEWGAAFVRAIGPEGLGPGETSPPIVLRSQLGYTGEQPRAQLLQHSQFQDARVEIFGKHGSAQFVKMGDVVIKRQLLTS